MKVLVCGGRDYADVPRIWRELDRLDAKHQVREVIDGASDDVTGPYVGADYWAHQWALARNKPICRMHADWKEHGRAAGPIRNKRMLDEGKPDLVVAFPGGRGTANMIEQARKANVRILHFGTMAPPDH